MSKAAWLLVPVLLAGVAVAQQAAPPPVQANDLVEKETAPSYSDLYCAGFLTKQTISRTNYVVAGSETPFAALYGEGSTVFLKGGPYQPDQLLTVVRQMSDPNRYEPFKGHGALLQETGVPYAEIGRVRVLKTTVDHGTAVARLEFSCQPLTPGDLAVPFQEKPPITFRKDKVQFDEFPGPSTVAGRIVLAKDFDTFVATGAKVYISAGANKGVKPGDYLRVTRGYSRQDMDAAAAQGYNGGIGVELQKDSPKTTTEDISHLPRRAVGEVIVLSVTPTSATAMVTLALEAIHVGDTVEIETPRQ